MTIFILFLFYRIVCTCPSLPYLSCSFRLQKVDYHFGSVSAIITPLKGVLLAFNVKECMIQLHSPNWMESARIVTVCTANPKFIVYAGKIALVLTLSSNACNLYYLKRSPNSMRIWSEPLAKRRSDRSNF